MADALQVFQREKHTMNPTRTRSGYISCSSLFLLLSVTLVFLILPLPPTALLSTPSSSSSKLQPLPNTQSTSPSSLLVHDADELDAAGAEPAAELHRRRRSSPPRLAHPGCKRPPAFFDAMRCSDAAHGASSPLSPPRRSACSTCRSASAYPDRGAISGCILSAAVCAGSGSVCSLGAAFYADIARIYCCNADGFGGGCFRATATSATAKQHSHKPGLRTRGSIARCLSQCRTAGRKVAKHPLSWACVVRVCDAVFEKVRELHSRLVQTNVARCAVLMSLHTRSAV